MWNENWINLGGRLKKDKIVLEIISSIREIDVIESIVREWNELKGKM